MLNFYLPVSYKYKTRIESRNKALKVRNFFVLFITDLITVSHREKSRCEIMFHLRNLCEISYNIGADAVCKVYDIE